MTSTEQQYKNIAMQNIEKFFSFNNISKDIYPKFVDLFPKKHTKEIQVLISNFVLSNNIKIFNLTSRLIKNTNINELNKIMLCLGFLYQNDFIKYLHNSESNLFNHCEKEVIIDGINKRINKLKGTPLIFQVQNNTNDNILQSDEDFFEIYNFLG